MLEYTKKDIGSIVERLSAISVEIETLLSSQEEYWKQLRSCPGKESELDEAESVCDALDEAIDGIGEALDVLGDLIED